MNRKDHYLKISKQVSISYFFSFLTIAFQPLLIALLTRTLSIEGYGIYSLLFVTVSLLSVFFRFGFVQYITSKIPGLNEEDRVRSIISLLAFSSFLLLIAGGLLYLFRGPIISILGIKDYSSLWILSLFIILFVALCDQISSYILSIKKIFLSSFLGFLIKCSWIIALFAVFFTVGSFSLNTVFILWLAGVLLSVLLTIFFIRHEFFYFFRYIKRIDFDRLKSALRFSLPLIFVISFSMIIALSDRYVINIFLGKSGVAIYSLAYGIVAIIVSIPAIFQEVIQPYFAEKWNLKKNPSLYFNVLIKYSLMIVFPAIIGMFVLRNEIVSLISGPKYLAAAPIMAILLLFPLFAILIEIFNKTMFLRDMIKHTAAIYFAAAVLNIVLNFIFIPVIGITAAAYSTVVSYFLVLVILFYFRPRRVRFQLNFLRTLRILAASVLMGVLILPINPIQYWSKIGVMLLAVIIYVFLLFILDVFTKGEKELMSFAFSKLKKSFLHL